MKNSSTVNKLKDYIGQHDCIDFALIFGSFATGKNHGCSDIDIALHTGRELQLLEIGEMVSEVESILKVNADIIVINNIYKSRPLFAYNIIKDNIPIVINNDKLYVDYKKKTYLYYLDTEYLRKIVYSGLNRRIMNNQFGETGHAK